MASEIDSIITALIQVALILENLADVLKDTKPRSDREQRHYPIIADVLWFYAKSVKAAADKLRAASRSGAG